MPVTLTIKNVPDETVEQLRKRAEQNHRSLQGELMTILEDATLGPRPLTVQQVRALNQALGLKSESSVEMIREMRDTRYGG